MSHPATSASVVGMNAAMAELVKLTMSCPPPCTRLIIRRMEGCAEELFLFHKAS